MKNFLNLKWVKILSWVFILIGTVVLLLGGTTVEDLTKIPSLVWGIILAIGLLITFIREQINKKDVYDVTKDKGKIIIRNTIDSEEDRKRLNPDS